MMPPPFSIRLRFLSLHILYTHGVSGFDGSGVFSLLCICLFFPEDCIRMDVCCGRCTILEKQQGLLGTFSQNRDCQPLQNRLDFKYLYMACFNDQKYNRQMFHNPSSKRQCFKLQLYSDGGLEILS